jgi:hypothetical protein
MSHTINAGQLRALAITFLEIGRKSPELLMAALANTVEKTEEIIDAANHNCVGCPAEGCDTRTEPYRGKLSVERKAAAPSGRKLND